MSIKDNIRKTKNYMRKNGLKETVYALAERIVSFKPVYSKWSEDAENLENQRKMRFDRAVKFSIIVPAYKTNTAHFSKMIESVISQTYHDWELIIGDASGSDALKAFVTDDERIRYYQLEENTGISGNTNTILDYVTGDFVCLLDHDDYIEPSALYEFRKSLAELENKHLQLENVALYTDEDKCDGAGKRFFDPNIKLDFNLDHLLSNNYICHFLCMNTALIKRLGFRSEYDGAQDYDLILRAVLAGAEFIRIPKVLYHWRCHEESTAANPESKMYAYDAGKAALEDFIKSKGWKASVRHSSHLGYYVVQYENLWQDRSDVIAVTGPIYKKGRIVGGALDENGQVLYAGVRKGFSGYMHRVSMMRDVDGVMKEYATFNPNSSKGIRYLYDPNYSNNSKL